MDPASPDYTNIVVFSATVVGCLAQNYMQWRCALADRSDSKLRTLQRPPEPHLDWLSDAQFAVLSAICDTFVPSLPPREVTADKLREAMESFYPGVTRLNIFDIKKIASHRAFLSRGALELKVSTSVAQGVKLLLPRENVEGIAMLLQLLSTSVGCYALTGYAAPFQHLPLQEREAALKSLRSSKLADFRSAYATFRKLTGSLFLSHCTRTENNPNWIDLDYEPFVPSPPSESAPTDYSRCQGSPFVFSFHSANTFDPTNQRPTERFESQEAKGWTLSADVVVVGSGAGGGTLAYELVLAGYDVILVEKGGYYTTDDFQKWREKEAFERCYERGGLNGTADGHIMVLAGSCVGGGTTVNWCASFRPPDYVMKEWESLGMEQFGPRGSFHDCVDRACVLMNVNSDNSFRHDPQFASLYGEEARRDAEKESAEWGRGNNEFAMNANNVLLWNAAKTMGYRPERIARNVKSCVDCGSCCFGCQHSSKMSTLQGMIGPILRQQDHNEEKCAAGGSPRNAKSSTGRLRLIPYCMIDKILQESCGASEGGRQVRATGVVGSVLRFRLGEDYPLPPEGKLEIRINAPVVVSAGGATHSPALLLRSGLKNRKIGKHLTLHPVLSCAGVFPEVPTALNHGVGMGVVVRNPPIVATPGDTYGVAIETPPVHPGLVGAVTVWPGKALLHKIGMLNYPNLAAFIGISRDRSQESNRITISKEGEPNIHYAIASADHAMLRNGLRTTMRLMHAAGAKLLIPAVEDCCWFPSDLGKEALETFIENTLSKCLVPSTGIAVAAHQMSSCRMSPHPEKGPVDPRGETHEVRNLFVADASVFPTSLGVNPMITVVAFGVSVSRNVQKRLQELFPNKPLVPFQLENSCQGCEKR